MNKLAIREGSNIASVNAQANLTAASPGLNKALMRLSIGLRITDSGNDSACLAAANAYCSDVAMRFNIVTQSGIAALAQACPRE
jgi:flagellin-like hook-associated protein FlgL